MMKSNHRHLSIGHRLTLGVLIPLSLAACAAWVASDVSGSMSHERTEIALREQIEVARWSQNLALEAQRERAMVLELAAVSDEEHRTPLVQALGVQRQKIRAALDAPQALATQRAAEARQLDAVRAAFVAYWAQTEAASRSGARVEWEQLQLALSRWQHAQDVERHAAADLSVDAGPLSANAKMVLTGFLLLCALGSALVMLRLNVRAVRRPLDEARLTIEALSRGDYQRRVHIERLDEAGDVLVALDDLSNYLAVMLPDDDMAMDASFEHIVTQLRTTEATGGSDIVDMTPMPMPAPSQTQPQAQKAAHRPPLAMGTAARA